MTFRNRLVTNQTLTALPTILPPGQGTLLRLLQNCSLRDVHLSKLVQPLICRLRRGIQNFDCLLVLLALELEVQLFNFGLLSDLALYLLLVLCQLPIYAELHHEVFVDEIGCRVLEVWAHFRSL